MKSTRFIALVVGGALLAFSAGNASAQRNNRYAENSQSQYTSSTTRQSTPAYQGTTSSRPSYGSQTNTINRSQGSFGQTADRSSSRFDSGISSNRQTTTSRNDRFASNDRSNSYTTNRQTVGDVTRSSSDNRYSPTSTVSNDRNDRFTTTASSNRYNSVDTSSRNDRFNVADRNRSEVRKSFTSNDTTAPDTRTAVTPPAYDGSSGTIDRNAYEDANASEFRGRHGYYGHHRPSGHYRPGSWHHRPYYHHTYTYRPSYQPVYRPYCPPTYYSSHYYSSSYYGGFGSVYYSNGPFSIGFNW